MIFISLVLNNFIMKVTYRTVIKEKKYKLRNKMKTTKHIRIKRNKIMK